MSGVSRVAPTTPVYRPQIKREIRVYNTQNKITSLPMREVKVDPVGDTVNMVVTGGLSLVVAGCALALLIHYLGGWGLVAMAALGLAVWGLKGLWREWA